MTGTEPDREPSRWQARDAEDAAAVLAVLSVLRRPVVDEPTAATNSSPQSFYADPAHLLRERDLRAGPGQFWESGLPG